MKHEIPKDGGGAAFPCLGNVGHNSDWLVDHGMTLRQRAAIDLRVPRSGLEWLDEMIRERLRDDLAAVQVVGTSEYYKMQSELYGNDTERIAKLTQYDLVRIECAVRYRAADALIAERERARDGN